MEIFCSVINSLQTTTARYSRNNKLETNTGEGNKDMIENYLSQLNVPDVLMAVLSVTTAVSCHSNSGTIRRKIYCGCICIYILLLIALTIACFLGYSDSVGDYLAISIGWLVGLFIAAMTEKG